MPAGKFWLVFCYSLFLASCIDNRAQDHTSPYRDHSHQSKVFGHLKYYRLYLPAGYQESGKQYPVIYFFHGWGGRYYKDDNALLDYVRLKELVDKYQVILIMWDGNIEEQEPRPYNIGNHGDIKYKIQMKDYFPELVAHIDTTYRTLSDRNHRGIIGFSMGGIMSFFLAGKYPDKVCAAVNLAGSPEFFIGYPGNHTLYPVRYTFKNLMEVHTRQHSGDTDILVYLNEEVRRGAEWEGNPYEFYGFRGGHGIDKPGEITAFDMAMQFVVGIFNKGLPRPESWSHYDLYEKFDVWGYGVTSNKTVPGYLYLRNVGKNGFGFYTHQWLPNGPLISDIEATITSAPRYDADNTYHIIRYSVAKGDVQSGTIKSDRNGCISMHLDGNGNEIGIYRDDDKSEFIALNYSIGERHRNLVPGDNNPLILTIFNRGGEIRKEQMVRVTVESGDSAVHLAQSSIAVKVAPGQRIITLPPLAVVCQKLPPAHGEPHQVKFRIHIEADQKATRDEIVVPVLFDAPVFTHLKLDDRVLIRDKIYGSGNGDGQADAGERILIYEGDHRLRLFTNDPWVISGEEQLVDEQIPAIWEDGFTLSSIISISKDCPNGHVVEFTGNYETNTYNPIERKVHWGKVRMVVNNEK